MPPVLAPPRVVVSTFYTPSHARLLDQFVESLLATGFPDGDLRIHEFPQECESAEYMSPGWLDTMHRKVRSVAEDFDRLEIGDILIHADCDVRWYRNPAKIADEELGSAPSRWQWDGWVNIGGLRLLATCAGLGMIRVGAGGGMIVSDWLRRVEDLHTHPYRHDQDALCDVISCHQSEMSILPMTWWSHAHTYGPMPGELWSPSMPTPEPPEDIVAHHANWCIGVDNKLALLERVAAFVAEWEGGR